MLSSAVRILNSKITLLVSCYENFQPIPLEPNELVALIMDFTNNATYLIDINKLKVVK